MNIRKVEGGIETEIVEKRIHTEDSDKAEMCFQKGRLAADFLFRNGLISQKERDRIIGFFRDLCHPDLASLFD